MAGGKETPRQKMVGLMYLVLLALLALQVGAEIMNKFYELDESMEIAVAEADAKAEASFAGIKKAVDEDGREEAMAALKQAEKLDKATRRVHAVINKIKDEMIEKTGGRNEETEVPIGMKNTDIAVQLTMNDAGKGAKDGIELETSLDDFVKTLNEVQKAVAVLLPKEEKKDLYKTLNLTPSGKEHPLFSKNEDTKNSTWHQISFDHTPMIAALAFLTEKQARVAGLRAEVLEKIKKSMGAKDIKFDNIFPMASAESKVVAAGTNYEAELFITATSSAKSFNPQMFMGKRTLPIKDNRGQVKFKASWGGGRIDPKNKNLMTKSWAGKIIMKDGTGKEVTYEDKFEYKVAKPVLQIQSAAVAALYRQCGNELIVNCPALGANYEPSFKFSGAQFRKGKKKGQVVIIPTVSAKTVTMTVSSGGTPLGKETFKVRAVPKPDVVVYAKGRPVDQKKGMTAPGPRSVKVKAEISDAYFVQNLPRDSKYFVSKWTAMLVRGRRPVTSAQTFTSSEGNFSRMASKAQPGDRILIEIIEVRRKRYAGGTEVVKLPGTPIVNIPLN